MVRVAGEAILWAWHRLQAALVSKDAVAESPDPTARWHGAQRDRGTPQGSAVSPVLANLFMHVCHERWRGVGCR